MGKFKSCATKIAIKLKTFLDYKLTIKNRIVKYIEDSVIAKKLRLERKIYRAFPEALKEVIKNGHFSKADNHFECIGEGRYGEVYRVKGADRYVFKISKKTSFSSDEDRRGNELMMHRLKTCDKADLYADGIGSIVNYCGSTTVKIDEEPENRFLNIFENAKGVSGSKFLKEKGENLNLKQRLSIANQLAKAIATLHSVGLVHQDIKRDNINICFNDNELSLKLLDFGAINTKTQQNRGTALYGSRNKELQGFNKDVYSYGILMLFNFFPGKTQMIKTYSYIINNCLCKCNKSLLKILEREGIIKLKEINSLENRESITPSDCFQKSLSNAETIEKFLDYLNRDKQEYDERTMSFFKIFFKKIIYDKNKLSMIQISRVLEDFIAGNQGNFIKDIFNNAENIEPKQIPTYLLKRLTKAQDKTKHREAAEVKHAKEEIEMFIEQNPFYVDMNQLTNFDKECFVNV